MIVTVFAIPDFLMRFVTFFTCFAEPLIVIVAFFAMPLNAPLPTLVTFAPSNLTVFNLLSPLNVFFAIVVTFFPIVAFVSFLQFANALAPIFFTFFPTSTVFTVSLPFAAFFATSVTL